MPEPDNRINILRELLKLTRVPEVRRAVLYGGVLLYLWESGLQENVQAWTELRSKIP